jgi:DNA-directed RNA polymerase beta' subunit
MGGTLTNEDDMTVKIYEIFKQNSLIQKYIEEGRDMIKINEAWNLL